MMRTPKLWPVAAGVFLLACTSETDLGNRSNASSSGGETAHGIIAGKPFTPTSAYAAFDTVHECTGTGQDMTCVDLHETISLIFSSEGDACGAAKSKTVAPGATIVALHLVPPKLGTHISTDAKFAVIDPSCASGAPLRASIAADQDSSRPVTVQITRVDATHVEGNIVSMTLDDGSSFTGPFSLALCSSALEDSVCR